MLTSDKWENACGKFANCGGGRVVFLGQQPDIVAQRQQALEQRARLVVPAEQKVVGEPEAAGEEGAFAGEPVGRRRRCRSAAQAVATSSRSIASTCRATWVAGGRNPTSGIISRLASSAVSHRTG